MTGTLKARVGGAWVPILGSGQEAANTARWNTAWGRVAFNRINTTSVTGIQSSDVTIVYVPTFTMTEGRRYRISAQGFVQKNSPDTTSTVSPKLKVDVTTFEQRNFTVIAPSDAAFHISHDMDYIAGAHNHVLTLTTVSGFLNLIAGPGYTCWIAIDDIGPITQASIAPPTAGPRVVASGNALGIVAMGAMLGTSVAVAANTYQNVTYPLAFTPQVGRRYRLVCRVRAVSALGNSAYLSPLTTGTTLNGEYWRWISGGYDGMDAEWVFDGNGVASTFQVQYFGVAATVFADLGSSQFYLEDVGPNMSPALPIPTTYQTWTPLPLATNWTSYGGVYELPGYRKIGDVVHLRGLLKAGAGAANWMATLPVGFRPALRHIIAIPSADNWSMVEIAADGTITRSSSGTALATNGWTSLSNVSFSTTA